ncbi:S8 family serine peptidase [Flavobacterium sp.]|uniref:S8 family peptidase n=1 Tax=Flavobacterium sp. TaxID=239 RepID=UPI002602E082|nr:S8 family serine peptidase [Flavobacterium sp.]
MKIIFTFLVVFVQTFLFAQEDAWVYLNNKPDAAFFLNNPLSILTQRALDRRASQNIELDDMDAPVHQAYIDQISANAGIQIMAKSKWMNALHVRGEEQAIRELTVLPFVNRIDFANKTLNVNTGIVANKNEKKRPEAKVDEISNLASGSLLEVFTDSQIEVLNGHLLHQEGYTGNGKIIALINSGFKGVNTILPFERIRNNNQIKGGYNFVTRDDNVYTGTDFGTKTLSTMAAYVGNNNYKGTAPDASYYLFVSYGENGKSPLEESLWVEAAEMADSLGVDILNFPLGFYRFNNPNYDYTYQDMNGETTFISRGANIAFSRGMIVVSPAGNLGNKPWRYITAPADVANVLTVGAINQIREWASFSSVGPTSDGRIKPDVMAMGSAASVISGEGTYEFKSSTMYASSLIAGMVACLWQALPNKTNAEILQLIKESADRHNDPDNFYGHGIPNFQLALEQGMLKTNNFTIKRPVLYPNPTSGKLTITGSDYGEARFRLYDTMGKEVMDEQLTGLQEVEISTKKLKSGIYLYTIITGDTVFSGKIIKK